MTTQMTDEQKRRLFHDGYVVLKGAVSDELVAAARARIKAAKKGENLSPAEELTDLVNKSTVTPILTEVMGRFDPPSRCHVGVTKQSGPRDHFTPLGYREKDLPYYGHGMHAEGLFTAAPPQEPAEGTPDEIYRRMISSGPKGDIWEKVHTLGQRESGPSQS